MNEKEKAEKRFDQTAEEMTITFIPQCNSCKKNINIISCNAFREKPAPYLTNTEDCPERIEG